MQKTVQPVVFSRTMFCEKCFYAKRPEKGSLYFVFGGKSQHIKILEAQKYGTAGFTPHIISYEGITTDGRIKLNICCGMVGCDMDVEEKFYDSYGKQVDEDDESAVTRNYYPVFLSAKTVYMEALQYASIKKWKDTGYEI